MTMKQKGFTLLELLIVVTVLGVLAAGALVAYDGIGESSKGTADANNIATIDGAIRTYRVVESVYPNQYDTLIDSAGAVVTTLDDDLLDLIDIWTAGNSTGSAVSAAMIAVGIDELQQINSASNTALILKGAQGGVNMAHNEASGFAQEIDVDGTTDWAVIAAYGEDSAAAGGVCEVQGTAYGTPEGTATALTNNNNLTRINDALNENSLCNLVLAVGFGPDAAQSTAASTAAIAATAASASVGADTYGRYIALFWVGQDTEGGANQDRDIDDAQGEIFEKARFLGVLTPDGKTLNEALNTAKGN